MKWIFKYPLQITDQQRIELPHNSKILSIETQNDNPVLYALVDDEKIKTETYSFIIHGTGHPAEDVGEYEFLGTLKMFNGSGMFHVFYKLL